MKKLSYLAVTVALAVVGAFVATTTTPAAAQEKTQKQPATIAIGQFPAVVDIEKGLVLITLTNEDHVHKILDKGFVRANFGSFMDGHTWPQGMLPFYTSDGYTDVGKRSYISVLPAGEKFILPLHLKYTVD